MRMTYILNFRVARFHRGPGEKLLSILKIEQTILFIPRVRFASRFPRFENRTVRKRR